VEGINARNGSSARIAAFVLVYRLPRNGYHGLTLLHDAATRHPLVRSKRRSNNIDPHKIGIMGFSAGGHSGIRGGDSFRRRRSAAADPINRVSSRPDLAVLVYR